VLGLTGLMALGGLVRGSAGAGGRGVGGALGAGGAGGGAALLAPRAAELPADLVAMTTHGAGGLRRAVLGSVADQVVRLAQRPVLVVRAGAGRGSGVEQGPDR
jgi:hypothetical protein